MTRLFRPVGLYELAAVLRTGSTRYPPRLSEQPIFYPVLDRSYAVQIASQWNPPDPNSGFAGFVTAFEVPDDTLTRYPPQTVGGRRHQELWVPAAEQAAFEDTFTGPIAVLLAFAGPQLSEVLPTWQGAAGEVPREDVAALVAAGPLAGGPLTEG